VVRARGRLAALALGALAGAGIGAGGARAEPPLCRAEVVLGKAHAYVGEPVLHTVRIEQRPEVVDLRWETSLSFPALRAEPLLGGAGPGIEERRVLFPSRAGQLALPAGRLACESADRVETTEVGATTLVAEEPPREGRPPGWAGLIGPVEVTTYATPDRVQLGESVSVSVSIRGETNVWAAVVPIASHFAPDAAEVFERPPELARDMGRTLTLRAYRSFDLVPRRTGPFEVPELRVAYFDPRTERYAEARAPAIPIEVAGPGDVAPDATNAAPAEAAPAAATPARRGLLAAAALGLGVGLGVGLAAGVALGLRVRRARRTAPAPARDLLGEALGALTAALRTNDGAAAAAAAARALRLALEPGLPGARTLAAEELAAAAPAALAETARLLVRLEEARCAGAAPAALLALAREAEAAALAR
jgi:hypothetical protein